MAAGPRPIAVGGARQRTVLGLLLLRAGRIVPVDALVDEVWNGRPPATARTQVAIVIAALRKAFRAEGASAEIIVTAHPGYQFTSDGHYLDSTHFSRLVAEAERASRSGRLEDASRLYEESLDLWRGPALSGVTGSLVEDEAARLEEQRLNAYDDATAVRLELGQDQELVPRLALVAREQPLRERTRHHLMLAQYRSGRRAEALETFREARRQLVNELGMEPGPLLQDLHDAVLRDDPALIRAAARPPTGDPRGPVRTSATDTVAAVAVAVESPVEVEVVPSELPPDVPGFTGREEELACLDSLLDGVGSEPSGSTAPTVGLVTGVAGVGKTGLAVRWANRVAERFPDGRLFVDLRGYDEQSEAVSTSDVLGRFLRSLGVASRRIPAGLEERTALYRSVLADRRVLLVLDNVRTYGEIRALLPGRGGSCVLTTSREPLEHLVTWPAEARVHLGLLPAPDAAELLCRIVGRQRMQRAPEATDRLVELCDRLPLALRIAGARLASKPHWTADHLVGRLNDERRRLDELSQGESQIRASFAMSYRYLSDAAARLYRRLGLLDVPDFTAWVGAALLDTDLVDAELLIEQLIDAQFVEVVGVDAMGAFRYRLQNLMRLYAGERAAEEESEAERAAARDRVFRTYLTIAQDAHHREHAGDNSVVHSAAERRDVPAALLEELLADPLGWYEAERLSLVAVIQQAARGGQADVAWDLTASMIGLFETRNYTEDWRICAQLSLEASRQAGDVLGQAVMRHYLGSMHLYLQRFDPAVRELEAALELHERAGSVLGRAMTLRNLAVVDRIQGRLGPALERLEEALDGFRQAGDPVQEAHALNNLAQVRIDQGRAELAVDLALDAVRLCEQGDGEPEKRGLAQAVHRLARACLALGRYPEAEEAFSRVAEISRGKSDVMGLGYALWGLGESRLAAGDPATALHHLCAARELARRTVSPLMEGQILLVRGRSHVALGDSAAAREDLMAAVEAFSVVDAPTWRVRAREALAELG
ncbi:AfsR/SARP family transcriptional regulator [Streptacidiphilus jiangxiensis]|uniref:AfsR/SARP family transcriptional regulator n=1 Tax=Streptacidiphilus jiangxiensis TaxID=235985 RepID=UPI0034E19C0C